MEFINSYFQEFPGIKRWMDSMRAKVKKDKYVETLSGFRRYLKGIDSNNRATVADSERQAINTPVQGSGASMTLQSLIEIDKFMTEYQLESKMIMTVHDSIVFDVKAEELYTVAAIVKTTMENIDFDWITVPIVSDLEIGRNYQDLVEVDFEELEGLTPDETFELIDKRLMADKLKHHDQSNVKLSEDIIEEARRLGVYQDGKSK